MNHRQGLAQQKKRIRYRSGSNFNAEYTRTFDWVMTSDRGKQQAYCKVCSTHFSVSYGRIDNVRRHVEGKKHLELQNGFLKKITDFLRVVPHFFFRNLTCLLLGRQLVFKILEHLLYLGHFVRKPALQVWALSSLFNFRHTLEY